LIYIILSNIPPKCNLFLIFSPEILHRAFAPFVSHGHKMASEGEYMNNPVLWAMLATLGTWLATAAGAGTVLFFPRQRQRLMDALLGFSAGVMIAASFWSLLLPAAERAEAGSVPPWLVLTVGFGAGAAAMWLSDRVASRIYPQEIDRTFLLVLSITLHNIPEGLAVGVAFGALQPEHPEALMAAISVAVGVGLQNLPEGAAVALPLYQAGHSKGNSFFLGQASALVEPVAGTVGALLVRQTQAILPWALSFAAGAMIMVAVHELIPGCHHREEGRCWHSSFSIIGGFSAMMLLDVMLS